MPRLRALPLAVAALAACAGPARAIAACADAPASAGTGARIAAVACAEHDLWYAPFIDENGRLASMRVAEAEGLRLRDGTTPAWRRVAAYWRGSGVRWPPPTLAAGADCEAADGSVGAALCRSFLVDTPWSAVFVSWVMTRAAVPGFRPSARHVDYVRDAFRDGATGPYRLADPDLEPPAPGDLLCYARLPSQVFGVAGFRAWLQRAGDAALAMHCDIVVSTAGPRARLVGGNVLQGVTQRVLPLNRLGRFWALPRRAPGDPECQPGNPAACNFNRQDWVALLKLTATAETAPAAAPAPAQCCVICLLPMAPGVKRCPPPEPTTSPVP